MNRQQRRAAAKQRYPVASGAATAGQHPIGQVFDAALGHYRGGRFAEVERLCNWILSVDPGHVHSLNLLGLLAHHRGQPDIALERIGRAIALNNSIPDFQHNLGNILRQMGRLEEAATAFQQALILNPNSVDTLYNLGNINHDLSRLDQAVAYFERALRLRPDSVEILNNLGAALHDQGRVDEAVACYARAAALAPDPVQALTNLGAALCDRGEPEEAAAQFERALALRGDHIEALNGLGIALRQQGRMDAAIAQFELALALGPGRAETHNNLALALEDLGRLDEAVAHYEHSLRLGPEQAETHNNLGNALEHQGRFAAAMSSYARGLALKPDYAEVHYNRGLLLLLLGDYERGWAEYEWRWRCKDNPDTREFGRPKWVGEPIEKRTILVHAEQGFGDIIQFVRYVPAVAARSEKVFLAVPRPIVRLAENMPTLSAVLSQGDPAPKFDLHCPLLSLPHAFGTTMETIPNLVPYLTPPDDASAAWAKRLPSCSELKVGLVWSGNPASKLNPRRSIPLAMLEPLWGIAGVRWFSLQVGSVASDIELEEAPIEDLSPLLTDFAETAAAIWHLDLVISVETAVAHLAGALGRPVWVPLAFVPAWRWLLDREDSPWYPTMRLFRQGRPGDWAGVIQRLADSLMQCPKSTASSKDRCLSPCRHRTAHQPDEFSEVRSDLPQNVA
jgi:tetratricopeptide (TPR) repeat protein